METINSLDDIATMVQHSASTNGKVGLDRSANDLALAPKVFAELKLKSRAYAASAKVLKTRVKVLTEMVSY